MSDWRNRIVKHGEAPASSFLANERNWRIHPKPQQGALTGGLNQVGWVDDVTVNLRTSEEWGADRNVETMVDGHLRVILALRKGDDTPVPVKYVDLTPEEEAFVLATLDPISAMAATDATKLDELLRDVQTGDAAVMQMIAELADKAGLDYGKPPQEAPGPQIDRAEELRVKWGVETGQLWKIGNHRLICGDCTDVAVVARVMGGEKSDCVFTSPPYNVDVQYDEHDDTNKNADEYLDFIARVCRLQFAQLKIGRPFIWNVGVSPRTFPHHHALLLENIGLKFIRQYIWEKIGVPVPYWYHTMNKRRARYVTSNYIHEMIYVFSAGDLEEGGPIEPDEIIQHDVFKINQTMATRDIPEGNTKTGTGKQINLERPALKAHPAVFPVELPHSFISSYTSAGEIVIDPFCGSGTTLVACERLGRLGRGIEISPAYCAVSLQRMADMGLTPELVEGA